MVKTQLCKLRGTSDTFRWACLFYLLFIIWFLWTINKPTLSLLILSSICTTQNSAYCHTFITRSTVMFSRVNYSFKLVNHITTAAALSSTARKIFSAGNTGDTASTDWQTSGSDTAHSWCEHYTLVTLILRVLAAVRKQILSILPIYPEIQHDVYWGEHLCTYLCAG